MRRGRFAPQQPGSSGRLILGRPRVRRGGRQEHRRHAQLHAPAPRPRGGGRLVDAVQCRVASLLVLAEQELHIHGRRAGHRGGQTQPGRRGAEVLSRRRPGRAEQQPEVDARQRSAPHVHGPAERTAAHAGSSPGPRPSLPSPSPSSPARISSTTPRGRTCSRPSCRRRPA